MKPPYASVLVLVMSSPWLHAHGGVGVPVLRQLEPARGVVLEATDTAALRWADEDPDDNASLRLLYTPRLQDPDSTQRLTYLTAVEDCDPSDAGPMFTGIEDAGLGVDAGRRPQDLLDGLHCRATPRAACDAREDCYLWNTRDVPAGNYFVRGVLDDHWPDGGGGNLSFQTSRGVVRVRKDAGNVVPVLLLTEPDGVADQVDTCFRVRWVDDDPDNNATIKLWIVQAFGLGNPILIAEGIREDDVADGFDVNMVGAPLLVDYQIVAEIDDGINPVWRVSSEGYVTRYVRILDGGVRFSHDGGCEGVPPAWPNGNTFLLRDGGVSSSLSAGSTSGSSGRSAQPFSSSSAYVSSTSSDGPGAILACSDADAPQPGSTWLGPVAAVLFASRRRRRGK